MINKNQTENIARMEAIPDRIIYVKLRLEHLTIKIIQVYAPTSSHEDEKVTHFNKGISECLKADTAPHTLVIKYFSCKIEIKQMNDGKYIGHLG